MSETAPPISHPSGRGRRLAAESAAVLALGTLAIAGLFFQLQRELSPRGTGGAGRVTIGKLGKGVNTVQRKFDKEVLWDSLATSETLYNRDAVRTADGSEATVEFEDGTRLDLAENSLVILDRSDQSVEIEFLKGNVFAKGGGGGGKSVAIKTASGRVEVGGAGGKGGALNLSSGAKGLEVTVSEGSAQLVTAKGATSIGLNERGQLSSDGVKKEKLTLLPQIPARHTSFVTETATAQVPFEWTIQLGGPRQVLLQLAKDSEFKNLIWEKTGSGKLVRALAPGTYYWRLLQVSRATHQEETSETRSFKVVRHPTIRMDSPEHQARKSYYREQAAQIFKWRMIGGNRGGRDELLLARDMTFKNQVSVSDTRSEPLSMDGSEPRVARFEKLEDGDYFWKIVTRYENTGPDGKQTVSFSTPVRKYQLERMLRLPSPELLEPQPGATLGLDVSRKQKLRLVWNPVSEASQYRLVIATDPKFKSIVLQTALLQSAWEGDAPSNGRLYWTVVAAAGANPSEEDSKPARAREFTLTTTGGFELVAPEKGKQFEFFKEPPEIRFAWSAYGKSASYQIEIGSDPEFLDVLEKKTIEGQEWKTDEAPAGSRYWRVKALDPNGRVVAMSEVGSYRLREAPIPTSPEKLLPEANARIKINDQTVTRFSWKASAGAVRYRLTVLKQDSAGQFVPAFEKNLTDPAAGLSYEQRLNSGIYRWDVQAVDSYGRISDEAKPRQFELRNPTLLAAPMIQMPEMGARVVSDEPKAIPLKWDKVEGAKGYEVVIEKVHPDGKREVVRKEEVPENLYEAPASLSSGEYAWKVSAVGVPAGSGAKAARPGEVAASQFSIKWEGVLSAPSGFQVRQEQDRAPAQQSGGGKIKWSVE